MANLTIKILQSSKRANKTDSYDGDDRSDVKVHYSPSFLLHSFLISVFALFRAKILIFWNRIIAIEAVGVGRQWMRHDYRVMKKLDLYLILLKGRLA